MNVTRGWTVLALSVFALRQGAAADVIHVDVHAPPGGNGGSWATAYDDLHFGLSAAAPGDEVWVASGEYTPAPPGGARNRSFELRPGVAVLGGFSGVETSADERDWTANETVLSGDLDGDDGPYYAGVEENSLHVVDGSDGDAGTLLDGFTITGGHADGGGDDVRGAGMFIADGQVTARHCVFRANVVTASGGIFGGAAVYLRGGSLTLESCLVDDNRVETHGGGLLVCDANHVVLRGCTISNNRATVGGGMEFVHGVSATIEDCHFIGNTAASGGGGVFCLFIAQTTVTRSRFEYNYAAFSEGGGLITGGGGPNRVRDCVFVGNIAGQLAGGWGGVDDSIAVNCVFSRNVAYGAWGGGAFVDKRAAVINCSFSNNAGNGLMTDRNGGVIPTVRNCVFWGNTPEQVTPHPSTPDALPNVSYCNVQGGWSGPGSNNIDGDPLFIQPGTDDLHLADGSPCVDAGDNGSIPAGVDADLDGNPRILGGIVDIGAYEGASGDVLPPETLVGDLDGGETVFLIPDGAEFDPMTVTCAVLRNDSGPDDSTASLAQHDEDMHSEADGHTEQGAVLVLDSTIPSGAIITTIAIPFGADDLADGQDPLDLDLTIHDATTGNWGLAVAANMAASPGHLRTIGDRSAVSSAEAWTFSTQLGDYGVHWNPELERGFAWAVVDVLGDFALGESLCPPDAHQPPNGFIGFEDMLFVMSAWGDAGDGPFDVTGDGVVDVYDLLTVIAQWGTCPGT